MYSIHLFHKKTVFFIYLLFFSFQILAQDLHLNYTKFIGGAQDERAYHICATKDKGVIITGTTTSNNTGDIPVYDSSQLGLNLLVAKLDSSRNLQWVKVWGGSQADNGVRIIQTYDGGYAVLAESNSYDGTLPTSNQGRLWLLKLDGQGDLQWQKRFGTVAYVEEALSLKETSDHGLIILATSTGDGGDVPKHYGTYVFENDWFLIKTDSLGNKQWAKTIGGTQEELHTGAILVANDGYYLASSTISRDHECTVVDTSWHIGVATEGDCFLAKLDLSGNVMWAKTYGSSLADAVCDATLDPSDSCIVIISSVESWDLMVAPNPQNPDKSNDAWVIKVDKNGNLIWAKTLGDNASDDYDMSVERTMSPEGYLIGFRTSMTGGQTLPGHYGIFNSRIILLDTIGNVLGDNIIGNSSGSWMGNAIQLSQGYAVCGTAGDAFAEGISDIYKGGYGDASIGYMNFGPVAVADLGPHNEEKLQVFPNPTSDDLYVTLPQDCANEKGILLIRDFAGKLVMKTKLERTSSSCMVDVQNLPSGPYLLCYKGKHMQFTTTFIRK